MTNGKFNIYGLINPETNEIFYIGCTTKDLGKRLKDHYSSMREAYNTDRRKVCKRHEYLFKLLPAKAEIVLLDNAIETDWVEKETFYISKYREINPNLTNVGKGGIGGNNYSDLTIEDKIQYGNNMSNALKGIPKPEGFAEHLSEIRKGKGNPAYGKSKYGKVVRFDDNNNIIKEYAAGYEFESEFGKYYYGNLIRTLANAKDLQKHHYKNKQGYWNFKHNLEFNPVPKIDQPFSQIMMLNNNFK